MTLSTSTTSPPSALAPRNATPGGSLARARWWVALGVAMVTAAVFARGVNHPFVVLDDTAYVTENPDLRLGWSPEGVRRVLTSVVINTWHPLTMLSHLVDVTLYGFERPWGHHLTSVLLHAANAGLAFLVLGRLSGRWEAALAAALLWALHPLRVESVAWVAERKDVLSGFWFWIALGAYAWYAERPSPGRSAAVALAVALGLLAKPMLVTVPCLLLLLDVWPLGRTPLDWGRPGPAADSANPRGWVGLIVEKLPLFALVVGFSVMTYRTQSLVVQVSSQPWGDRLVHVVLAYGDYLRQTIWPAGLAVYYPRLPAGEQLGRATAAAAVLLVVSGGAWHVRRRAPWVAVGWCWFLGMLVPVVGFVQVGSQARADRYTYLPAAGLAWAVALSLDAVARVPAARRVLVGTLGGVLAILAGLTWRQLDTWRDSETVFRRALAVTERNVVMEEGLAQVLLARGAIDEGLAHYDRALAIQPSYARALYGKGYTLHRVGRWEEAAAAYAQAIEIGYHGYQTRLDYGRLLVDMERYADARHELDLALEMIPQSLDARLALGDALAGLGRDREAMRHYRQALDAVPNSAPTVERIAWLLAVSPDPEVRHPAEAERLAQAVVTATGGQDARALDTWAAALAAQGKFRQAIEGAEAARRLLSGPGDQAGPRGAEAIARRLELYRRGTAYPKPRSESAEPPGTAP